MAFTPAAAAANVYGKCVTTFNQFVCVQTRKKKKKFFMPRISKIKTQENAKIKRAITDSQNHVDNIAFFPPRQRTAGLSVTLGT